MEKPPSASQESMEKSPAQEPSQPSKSATNGPKTPSAESRTEPEWNPQNVSKTSTTPTTTKSSSKTVQASASQATSEKTPEKGSQKSVSAVEDHQQSSRLPEKSSFLMQMAILGTISAQFIGNGSINYTPAMVLEHGGFWYLFAHITLTFFLGLPMVFFELLIGQITRKGVTAAYGMYCKAIKGIGVGFFIVSMFMMAIRFLAFGDNAGFNSRMLISAITLDDHALTCDNQWNTKNCFSLYESMHKCNRTDNKQFAYINGNCTDKTYDKNLQDAITEYQKHFSSHSVTGMDHYKFVAKMLILIVPLALIFVNVKYTFYTFGSIFVVYLSLFLIYMSLITLIIGDIGAAIGYIWHRTEHSKLMTSKGLSEMVAGVMWNLSIHGVITPIGSFLRPKDKTFKFALIPTLICLTVAILSVLKTASALSSLQNYQPASGYLYGSMQTKSHGVLLHTQLMLSHTNYLVWLGLLSIFKLLGDIGQMSFAVLGFKAVFRDHLRDSLNKLRWKLGILAIFIVFHTIIIVIYCVPDTQIVAKEFNLISAGNYNKRVFYYIGVLACIQIYGEIDFRIDLLRIYKEHENWRRFFSPIGPVMFGCWKYVLPMVLLINQAYVFVENMKKFREHPISMIQPLAVAAIAYGWVIAIIVKHKMKGKSVRDAFMPSEDHPSYKRIMARQTISTSNRQ